MTTLYSPPDVYDAYQSWRANCGPCSLAAVLGVPVADVRDYFPGFPARAFTNPTTMKAAIGAAGRAWRLTSLNFYWPLNGLAFVQWEGPWTRPGVPIGAAYRHTHWVGVRSRNGAGTDLPPAVYDVNADGWLTRPEWEAEIVSDLLAANRGATGWHVRTGIEVLGGQS